MIELSKAQKQAIFDRGNNLLISAAAGSGKTMVLVERIIHLALDDKIPIDRMLIVTFTNAAASQMKDKIRNKLEELLEDSAFDRDLIIKQIRSLAFSHISTMHAFSIDIIRKYFEYLGIDPSFKIINSAQEIVLKQKAIKEVFDQEYIEAKEDFIFLLEAYGGKKLDSIEELIEEINQKIQAHDNPIEWLKKTIEEKKDNNLLVKKDIEENLNIAKSFIDEAIELSASAAGPVNYLIALENDESFIIDLKNSLATSLSSVQILLNNHKFEKLKQDKNSDKDIKEKVKNLREEYKNTIKEITNKYFSKSSEFLERELYLEEKITSNLVNLVEKYNSALNRMIKEKGFMSFSNIEHLMIKLLEIEEVREEIKEAIDYIFFDEYQDINPLQEKILNLISKENNSFFVGDIKQSIYGFRLAEPKMFISRYEEYSNGSEGKVINLSNNYRSEPLVIKFINHIFINVMTKKLGDVDYKDPGQQLVAAKQSDCGKVIVALTKQSTVKGKDYNPNALYIAKEIKKLAKEGVLYKDIVILMRSVKNKIDDYEDCFKELEIPFYSDVNNVSLEDPEVAILINLLKIVNNYYDDLALLSVLFTPIGGLNEEELAIIRNQGENEYIITSIKNFIEKNIEDEIRKKLTVFLEKIETYRSELRKMTLSEFTRYVLIDSGLETYISSLYLGEDKLQNVYSLIKRIEEYEEFSYDGLVGFLSYVEKMLAKPSSSLEPTKLVSQKDDCVKIMSIHKSKGLEFKVVFYTDTEKEISNLDKNSLVMIDNELGLGLKIVDPEAGCKFNSSKRQLIENKKNKEIFSEEMRLCYVATTRAVEYLYIVGNIKNEENLKKIISRPNYVALNKSKSVLEWMLSVISRDKIFADIIDSECETDIYTEEEKKRISIIMDDTEYIQQKQIEKFVDFTIYNKNDEIGREKSIFEYQYPNMENAKKPIKKTVSEISIANKYKTDGTKDFEKLFPQASHDFALTKPDILVGQNKYKANEIGTIYHTVFQNISIKEHTQKSINDELDRMIVNELLTENEKKVIDVSLIEKFFKTDLSKRIIKSKKLDREVSFTMRLEEYFVDGQIDGFFIEDNEIVLYDLKTDVIISETKYNKQLKIYKEALEEALKMKVKAMYLYWIRHAQVTEVK